MGGEDSEVGLIAIRLTKGARGLAILLNERCPSIRNTVIDDARPRDRPAMTSNPKPRILIVRLSAIGDCVHAAPVVEAIRNQVPEAFIGWVAQPGGLGLLEDLAAVDRFHRFPRGKSGFDAARAMWELRAELRAERYDVALDLQGLTKSGLVAWLSGARRRLGFDGVESRELNRFFLNERRVASGRHVVDRNLSLLAMLELEVPARGEWNFPEVDLGGTEIGDQLAELSPEQPRVVISPGTTWPTKFWPTSMYAELAGRLAAEGCAVVVAWAGPNENRMADEIAAAGPGVFKAPPTSLMELRGLLQRAQLLVANDSGPMHIAVAVGTPTLSLFGPTDPERNGPYGADDPDRPVRALTLADGTVQRIGEQQVGGGQLLDCQHCWKKECARGDLACLHKLRVDDVFDVALKLLSPTGVPRR